MPDHQQSVPAGEGAIRDGIRADIEATKLAFHATLAGCTAAEWRRRCPGSAWTVAGVLTHLTWSLELVPREVASARSGKGMFNLPAPVRDFLSMWITRLSALRQTPTSLRERYDVAHEAALQELAGVKPDEWRMSAPFYGEGRRDIEALFRAISEHFTEHAALIRPLHRDASAR